jgi:hypothetical protein
MRRHILLLSRHVLPQSHIKSYICDLCWSQTFLNLITFLENISNIVSLSKPMMKKSWDVFFAVLVGVWCLLVNW